MAEAEERGKRLEGNSDRSNGSILEWPNPDFVVVNTDGWVEGEDAINYKVQLIGKLNPDIIFCIQQKDELAHLLNETNLQRQLLTFDSFAHAKENIDAKNKLLFACGFFAGFLGASSATIFGFPCAAAS